MTEQSSVLTRFQQSRHAIERRLEGSTRNNAIRGALEVVVRDEKIQFPMTVVAHGSSENPYYELGLALDTDPREAEYFTDIGRSSLFSRIGPERGHFPAHVSMVGLDFGEWWYVTPILEGIERAQSVPGPQILVPEGFFIFRYKVHWISGGCLMRPDTKYGIAKTGSFEEAVHEFKEELSKFYGFLSHVEVAPSATTNTWRKVGLNSPGMVIPTATLREAEFQLIEP